MASAPLAVVAQAIQDIVLDFTEATKKSANPVFHMKELTDYVTSRVMVAPDSPGRILRQLRRDGYVDYRVESRSQSLYRVF